MTNVYNIHKILTQSFYIITKGKIDKRPWNDLLADVVDYGSKNWYKHNIESTDFFTGVILSLGLMLTIWLV